MQVNQVTGHTWPQIATSSPDATENCSPCRVGPLCTPSRLLLDPTELAMLFVEAVGSLSLYPRAHCLEKCTVKHLAHALGEPGKVHVAHTNGLKRCSEDHQCTLQIRAWQNHGRS